MPLKHDPEYGAELATLRTRVNRENATPTKVFVVVCPASFLAVFFLYRAAIVDGTTAMLIAIGLATFLLGLRLLEIANTLNVHLTIQTGAIEWIGRKQLEEYDLPKNS